MTHQDQNGGWVEGDPEIVYQSCRICERIWYFRRDFCPHCGAREPQTIKASGSGRVYAVSVVHRAPAEHLRAHAPYMIVMIDADEGFRLMAHGEPSLAIGDRVQARFINFDGRLIPRFARLETSA